MEISPALIQFLGSLAAILALAGIARWLRLGPAPQLTNETAARHAAEEAVSGFTPVSIGLDRSGKGAIMRDAAGRLLVLRPHGVHFAGRLLTTAAHAQAEGDVLLVDTGERRFGAVRLVLDDPTAWGQAIAALKSRNDA